MLWRRRRLPGLGARAVAAASPPGHLWCGALHGSLCFLVPGQHGGAGGGYARVCAHARSCSGNHLPSSGVWCVLLAGAARGGAPAADARAQGRDPAAPHGRRRRRRAGPAARHAAAEFAAAAGDAGKTGSWACALLCVLTMLHVCTCGLACMRMWYGGRPRSC